MALRRVVTGFDADNEPVVLFDGEAPVVTELAPSVGATLIDLWRADAVPLDTTSTADPTLEGFPLMPAGAVFRIIDFAPSTADPMWHTTASADFNYVVSGAITVLIGSAGGPVTEVGLAEGDVYIHRGPCHAWVNRAVARPVGSSAPASRPSSRKASSPVKWVGPWSGLGWSG